MIFWKNRKGTTGTFENEKAAFEKEKADIKAFRDIGQTFTYLGRTCVVVGHTCIYPGIGIRAALKFEYCDNHGVIHGELATGNRLNAIIACQESKS